MGFATEKSQVPSEQTFALLIECSGAPGVFADGLGRLRPAGRAAMVGMSKEKAIVLPLAQLNP
jgi:L-iditol 2-dehydrogenase